ncbi:MAG: hypothetical protein AMXMBFR48_28930 [Ignavibacteriales bacterium]
MKDHNKGILFILISAMLWSTGGLFIKILPLDAFQISFARSVFAAGILIVLSGKSSFRVNKLVALNSLFYAGILILFVAATKLTTAANAIFLQYTAPIYVLVFEPLLLKTGFKRKNIYSVFICFLGMALFFLGDLQPGHLSGNLLALLSGVAFAAFLIGMRKNGEEYQNSTVILGNILIAVLCIGSFEPSVMLQPGNLMMTAYLGIFQIGTAYFLFNLGLKRVQAIEASLISMIEPVLNPVWVFIWHGETPSGWAILGGSVILTGLIIKTLWFDRRDEKPILVE